MIIKSREVLPNGDVIVQFEHYRELIGSPHKKWSPNDWINRYGYYEKGGTEAVQRLLRPGDTAVDVGANMGYYTMMMASLVGPGGRVLAFEPVGSVSRYLEESVKLNGFTNVELFAMCLGAEDATLSFDRRTYRLNVSGSQPDQEIQVPVRLFDTMAAGLGIARLTLVKIDVEGAEMDVLQGMRHTVAEHRPHLILEIHPHMIAEFGHRTEELLSLLEAWGYTLEPLDPGGINLTGPRNCHVHGVPPATVDSSASGPDWQPE